MLKYFAAWFPIVLIAILNGTIRQFGYRPLVGELAAHQISTVSFILLFGVYVWTMNRLWRIASARQAWQIGTMWLGMTIAFEFGFGHFVMGHPWSTLLHDYNILEGRVWVVVLIACLVMPTVVYRWGARNAGSMEETGGER